MKRTALIVFIAMLLGPVTSVSAIEPIDALRTSVDQVISILNDPQYVDLSKKDIQREKIWNTIKGVFDFDLIAQLTLGQNRKAFKEQELKSFIEMFAELMGNTYIRRLQEEFKNEKITYLSQDLITATKAQVKTTVLRKGVEVPIDYSMRLLKEEWKIYDIRIEGISLVQNYRAQFQDILLKKSPADLNVIVKEKIAEQIAAKTLK